MSKDNKDDFLDFLAQEDSLKKALSESETEAAGAGPETPADLDDQAWVRAKEMGIPYVRISLDQIDPELVRTLPEDLVRRNVLLPYLRIGNDLTVIMGDPENRNAIEDVKRLTGCEIDIALGEREEILMALDLAYGRSDTIFTPAEPKSAPPAVTSELFSKSEIQEIQQDPSGKALLDFIFAKSIEKNAGRIFIRCLEKDTIIQIRVRGELEKLGRVDPEWGQTLETRLAILSGLGAGGEVPFRSGHFTRRIGEKQFQIRISLLAHFGGREMVIQFQDLKEEIPRLNDFNLSEKDHSRLQEIGQSRRGLLFITGGRRSWAPAAAYSLLQQLDPRENKIVTIEAQNSFFFPEYSQFETGSEAGQARDWILPALHSLDPDVIFLDGIQTPEWQSAAFQLAAQDRLFICRLPFTLAAQALSFLSSLPESEDLIPVLIRGLLVVDRVRFLCPSCRVPQGPTETAPGKPPPKEKICLPGGCPECGHTGYRGQQTLAEFIPATPELKKMVRNMEPESEWEGFLKAKGYRKIPDLIRKELKAGNISEAEAVSHGVSGKQRKAEMARIDALLKAMIENQASDLHLCVGSVPVFRIHGELVPIKTREISAQDCQTLLFEIIDDRQKAKLENDLELDFAHEIEGARFRVNIFYERRGLGAAFRIIPVKIATVEELGLPATLKRLADLGRGLVLVTGATGSGKSTTLAALIDYINENRKEHIITVEDPIEFVHQNKKSLIDQREVGSHTRSFANALRAALREDPDIILVGEMRDLETIELAITAAETGHLVFGTLHTSSASRTVDRIINVFPTDQQEQIRMMLSESLKGIVSQNLCRLAGGKGRIAALEILIGSHALSNLIREGKTYQILSLIQTGKKEGMQTMDQALMDFLMQKKITPQEAHTFAVDKKIFESYLPPKTGGPMGAAAVR